MLSLVKQTSSASLRSFDRFLIECGRSDLTRAALGGESTPLTSRIASIVKKVGDEQIRQKMIRDISDLHQAFHLK